MNVLLQVLPCPWPSGRCVSASFAMPGRMAVRVRPDPHSLVRRSQMAMELAKEETMMSPFSGGRILSYTCTSSLQLARMTIRYNAPACFASFDAGRLLRCQRLKSHPCARAWKNVLMILVMWTAGHRMRASPSVGCVGGSQQPRVPCAVPSAQ